MAVYDIRKSKKRMQNLAGFNKILTGKSFPAALAVKCHNGTFVGTERDGVRSYKGIPYALPPTGSRRWKAPEPAPENSGVYEARFFGNSCIQTEEASERASLYLQGEDCLTLNIWTYSDETASSAGKNSPVNNVYSANKDSSAKRDFSADKDASANRILLTGKNSPVSKDHTADKNPSPEKEPSALKPVMVFIHGGSYGWGGTADPLYDGHNFVKRQKNVVLVTINYRIGLFGFIDFSRVKGGEAYSQSTNLGLLDQICALAWIRRNIRAFGGDPDKVTLFGESAGASSVSLLPLIDSARGLFRRVIAESGSIAFTYSRQEAQELTDRLLAETGAASMEDLISLDEDRIRAVNEKLNDHNIFPVRDGSILPEDLYEAYQAGRGAGIDMLIGTNADETRYWIGEMGGWLRYWCVAPLLVRSIIHSFKKEDRALAGAFMLIQKGSAVHRATEFFNELIFRVPSIVQAALHAENGGKTYMYYWTKRSAIPHFGACHAVELAYVFGNIGETIYTGKKADRQLSDTVQDMWVRFAASGDPGTADHPWEKYEPSRRMTMLLGDEIRMVPDLKKEDRILIEPLLSYRYNGNYDQAGTILTYLKKKAGRAALGLALAGTVFYGSAALKKKQVHSRDFV